MFEPKPAPASPPVSADREEPDVLTAARALLALFGCAETCKVERIGVNNDGSPEKIHRIGDVGVYPGRCEACALRRAITAEEVRRARPAVEDPRDAVIAKLRALLELCATSIRDAAALTRDGQEMARRLHCLGSLASHEGGEQEFHACLAALRAAGVEPTPGAAQEGKVTT